MGGSIFSYSDYKKTTARTASQSTSQIYTATSLDELIDPSKIKNGVREACDSDANPNSTPIIIGLDFTGSMQNIPTYMMKEGLGELFKNIYERKPVSDPQVLFCGIGDVVAGDPSPFQVGQFESQCDLLIDGLTKFWLDGCRGGGNNQESYDLPYYFAANMTKSDAFTKRNKKGYLITIGDEPPPSVLLPNHIQSVFGFRPESAATFEQLIAQVRRSYIPIHIVIDDSYTSYFGLDKVLAPWRKLLGEDVVVCSDYTKLSEIIVSILQVKNGMNVGDVVASWDNTTALAVQNAIGGLATTNPNEGSVVF